MTKTSGILIVEDEAIVASDVERILRRKGYNPVGTAATGPDAIRRARELEPEMILMDVRLRGDMNGIEAAQQIEAERNVSVIYMTAFTERALSELPLGALCLAKPFTPIQLFGAIDAALSREPGITR